MSEPTNLELVVDAGQPPSTLVLASTAFLTTLAQVEEDARDLKITDAASAQLAASLQIRLTDAGKALDKQRAALKAPFIEINRRIEEAARGPAARIEAAKNLLKHSLTQFDAEQREAAAAAERQRQADLRALEAKRADELRLENERKLELERIAAASKEAPPVSFDEGEPMDFDEPAPPQKTETQVALENLKHAPAPVVARPSGITFKTTLIAIVEDTTKLPEPFVERSAKMKAINATFCAGWKEGNAMPECPGVRFEVKREAVSTGRNSF